VGTIRAFRVISKVGRAAIVVGNYGEIWQE
jgi:hypothetical protein